jgi:ribonuclease P protein component
LISVPKKAVRLATHRNRLKRLIREAFRKSTGLREDVVYGFRVRFEPGDALKLAAVQAAMKKLLEENV